MEGGRKRLESYKTEDAGGNVKEYCVREKATELPKWTIVRKKNC